VALEKRAAVKNESFDLADVNARRLGECQDSDFVALCLSIYQSLSSRLSLFFPQPSGSMKKPKMLIALSPRFVTLSLADPIKIRIPGVDLH